MGNGAGNWEGAERLTAGSPTKIARLRTSKEGLFRGIRSRKEANVAGSGASSPEEEGCVKGKRSELTMSLKPPTSQV